MAVLDKLMFWKKKDPLGDFGKDMDMGKDFSGKGFDTGRPNDLGLPRQDPGLGIDQGPGGLPGIDQGPGGIDQGHRPDAFKPTPPQPSGSLVQMQQPFQVQPAAPKEHNYMVSKDIEIISSKLDALRAAMESINQRLANIERVAMNQQEDKRW